MITASEVSKKPGAVQALCIKTLLPNTWPDRRDGEEPPQAERDEPRLESSSGLEWRVVPVSHGVERRASLRRVSATTTLVRTTRRLVP